jgi:hypothetical protein
MDLAAGQCWTYRPPAGFEHSRLVIGAILHFQSGRTAVCCSVTEAPRRNPNGTIERVSIPFLPLTEPAFRMSAMQFDGYLEPPTIFAEKLQSWQDDPRGLSTFTVAFEGDLEQLIALQMAEIASRTAA